MRRAFVWVFLLGAPAICAASAAAAPAGQASAKTARAIDELQGRFKWGMSVEEVKKTLEEEVRKRYAEKGKKAVGDAFAQDKLSSELRSELSRIESSYIDFKGQKTPWEVSIIDREFAHGNAESMMVIEESQKKQRRFLFFVGGKLYKQMIAFDKQLFEGKSFAEFSSMIQNRYGRGVAKYSLNRKGEQVLDHLEWPPSGHTRLRAVDQSNFYDTFCLVIEEREMSAQVAPKHKENALQASTVGKALVREIAVPEKVPGDSNADIVDRITGRNVTAPKEREASQLTSEPSKLDAPGSTPPREDNHASGSTGHTAKPAHPAKRKGKGGADLDDLEM